MANDYKETDIEIATKNIIDFINGKGYSIVGLDELLNESV